MITSHETLTTVVRGYDSTLATVDSVAAQIASEFNCGFDDAKRAVEDAELNRSTEILGMFEVNCPGVYRVTLPDGKSLILFPEARVFGAAARFAEA